MKVRATQDGYCKYYRVAGDVFDWPDDQKMPVPPYVWVEIVPDETANIMQEVGEKAHVYECPSCGYVTQRRSKFCPDCGSNGNEEVEKEKSQRDHDDAIEGITGKRPPGRPKKAAKSAGVVDKDQEV